jgi:sulfite exporter TauE/SafE
MELFLTLLPVYLLGNLHCAGMCGPLVVLIGRHPNRGLYFLGRAASFSLAGGIAGQLGRTVEATLRLYNIPASAAIVFGGVILLVGVAQLLHLRLPSLGLTSRLDKRLSLLLLREQPLPVFLFGFFTVLLPCGQTMVVFSACAMAASPTVGLFNGFAFAALTSPSLWFAMRAHGLLGHLKSYYRVTIGILAIGVGAFSVWRGLAAMEVAPPVCHQCHVAQKTGS